MKNHTDQTACGLKRVILSMLPVLLLLSGCSHPRTIPNDTLGKIFKESFLANSYFGTRTLMSPTDSADVYRPILERFGYTVEDFENTLANFSKQKSAKLSDILEQAIRELTAERDNFDRQVATLDTIDARASRMFMSEVFFAGRIEARKIADTAKLRITVPVEPGTYRVSYAYYIDSLDLNRGLRTVYTVIDSADRRRNVNTNWLSSRQRQQHSTDVETVRADSLLQVLLGGYGKAMSAPHLTVDSLRILHFLPVDAARDSLVRTFIRLTIPHYEPTQSAPQDSSALRLDPVGDDPLGGGDD